MKKVHDIKLRIEFCSAVLYGDKTFEIRNNYRGYQKGDYIYFHPVDENLVPVDHPIIDKCFEITYVLSGWGLKENYVCFGIKRWSGEDK